MTDAGSNTRAATSPRRSTGVFDLGPVSDEERGDLSPYTRRWLTQDDLAREAHRTEHRDHGRDLHSLRREPRVAIGQWSFLVRTSRGNVLWDPPVHLDAEVEDLVRDLDGVAVIATSHPHLFAARIGWSRAFDRAPVLVNAHGAEWVPHPDPVIGYWTDEVEPLPGFRMIRLVGHLPSSADAITARGVTSCPATPSAVHSAPAGCPSSATSLATCPCRPPSCNGWSSRPLVGTSGGPAESSTT